jgi:hypothetical protein
MRTLLFLLALTTTGATQDTTVPGHSLRAAHIRVILEGAHAMVVASYWVNRTDEPLVFEAVRMPGQLVSIQRAFGRGFALDEEQLVDLHHLTAPAGRAGIAQVRIRYKVEGDYSRIPLFVPAALVGPHESVIRFTLIGVSGAGSIEDAYPTFERQPNGNLVAKPTELPKAILLPSTREAPSRNRIIQTAVILFLAAVAVYWAALVVRARRSSRRLTQ